MAKGCVHVHVQNGVVTNIFAHLTDLPENGVVHLGPEHVLRESEFRATHPQDADEVDIPLNLGDNSVVLKQPDNRYRYSDRRC
jgi:hypothetical protein